MMDVEVDECVETITFDDLCRLCISRQQFIDITTSPDIDKPIYADIMLLLSDNVKFSKLDKLPQGICEECAVKLLQFYDFRIQIESSYVELNSLFEKNDDKEEVEYEPFHSDEIDENDNIETIFSTLTEKSNIQEEDESNNDDEFFSSVVEAKDDTNPESLKDFDYTVSKNFITYGSVENSDDNVNTSMNIETSLKNELLSPDEEILWQKKLSYWIQNQEKKKQTQYNKTHKEKKCVQCTMCEKMFSHPYKLKAHMNLHYGIKYQCQECKKLFLSESNLKEHTQAIHLKLKQFGCDKCGRVFNKKHTLVKHLRVHSDETLYQCPHCPKSFKWKTSLDPHILSHTGEKPFQCQLCEKSYSADSGLRKHCRRFHDGEGIKPKKDSEYQAIYIQVEDKM